MVLRQTGCPIISIGGVCTKLLSHRLKIASRQLLRGKYTIYATRASCFVSRKFQNRRNLAGLSSFIGEKMSLSPGCHGWTRPAKRRKQKGGMNYKLFHLIFAENLYHDVGSAISLLKKSLLSYFAPCNVVKLQDSVLKKMTFSTGCYGFLVGSL